MAMSDQYEYEYEYEYRTPQQEHQKFVPKKTEDTNWDLLKQEQLEPYKVTAPIIKCSNIVGYVYSNAHFMQGSLKLNVKRQDLTQELLKFNFAFNTNQSNGISQQHYKLWDLIKSLANYNQWTIASALIYKPNNNEYTTKEISLFKITQEYNSQYILVANDLVFVLRSRLETNLILSTVWRDRINYDDFCLQLLGKL